MTLTKHDIRPLTDPALLGGYDELMQRALTQKDAEPEDTESICFECGAETNGEDLCPSCQRLTDELMGMSSVDRFKERLNEAYIQTHGMEDGK